MKKIFSHLFKKKKEAPEYESNISADAVPYSFKDTEKCDQVEVYRNLPFDHFCSHSVASETNQSPICNSSTEISLNTNSYVTNHIGDLEEKEENETDTSHSANSSEDICDKTQEVPAASLHQQHDNEMCPNLNEICRTLSDCKPTNITGCDFHNHSALQDSDSAHKISSCLKPLKQGKEEKNSGHTYIITISNSKHFHIGSQKTISSSGDSKKYLDKMEYPSINMVKPKPLSINDCDITNIKDILSDDDILHIALHVCERWRDFAKNLGFDEFAIEELEMLNDMDCTLIVYDIVKQFIAKYPGTTVGYMISVLKKTNEMGAIRKLLENR